MTKFKELYSPMDLPQIAMQLICLKSDSNQITIAIVFEPIEKQKIVFHFVDVNFKSKKIRDYAITLRVGIKKISQIRLKR